MLTVDANTRGGPPSPAAVLELLKPHTWFPPMWAFMCGVVSTGADLATHWPLVLAGAILAGPLVCGMSQAANDWCDRHVDAINEPHRPIPSGRVPGTWGRRVAHIMSAIALVVGYALGTWVFIATIFALAAAWAYSAEPVRMKKSGWWGPGLVALCYEGLPWFTGAAALAGGLPATPILIIAGLYALGAHGIMTLNDFKAEEGDRLTGVASLPVTLGPRNAALVACGVMAAAQVAVIACLIAWAAPIWAPLAIGGLLLGQFYAMVRLVRDPIGQSTWYNVVGVPMFVSGMLVAAFALRSVEVML